MTSSNQFGGKKKKKGKLRIVCAYLGSESSMQLENNLATFFLNHLHTSVLKSASHLVFNSSSANSYFLFMLLSGFKNRCRIFFKRTKRQKCVMLIWSCSG